MNKQRATARMPSRADQPVWGAVVSLMLGVFGLVTAEFLPVSLLTPLAADLGIAESLAGQAISTTAVWAFVSSLLVSSVTRTVDRRHVLIGFSVLLVVSNILVALADGFGILLLGRALLGIAIGGFWAMSTAIVMRLVPEDLVPRGLSITVSGVAAATIVAAPVGSYLGSVLGWRAVFFGAAGLGLLAMAVQWATLPRMAPSGRSGLRTLVEVMTRPQVGVGMAAALLIFGGHFALFTYVRPYLENVTGVTITAISTILLGFGLANYVGTSLGGVLLERSTRLTMILAPLVIGIVGIALSGIGNVPVLTAILIAVWGFAFGTVPVAWSTWVARTVPDEAEAGGGLLVAAIQVAIALGAGGGGVVLNLEGVTGVFGLGSLVLIAAALLISVRIRVAPAGAGA